MVRVHPFYMQIRQQGCVKNTNNLRNVNREGNMVGVARRHWHLKRCKQPRAGRGAAVFVEPEVLKG